MARYNQPPSLRFEQGAYQLYVPFDRSFVDEFKHGIPWQKRGFDPATLEWSFDPQYKGFVEGLLEEYGYSYLDWPAVTGKAQPETQTFDVRYVGRSKLRDDKSESSYGWSDGAWKLIIPRIVLEAWFNGTPVDQSVKSTSGKQPTGQGHYKVLGVAQSANPDEIKSAYRRMARQWHPDVCREPDAKQQFQAIQIAYDLLSNPMKRNLYDASIKMLASTSAIPTRLISEPISTRPAERTKGQADEYGYRSPLRCGMLKVRGVWQVGRFLVQEILDWQDILRGRKVLVVSWRMGDDKFTEDWVDQWDI